MCLLPDAARAQSAAEPAQQEIIVTGERAGRRIDETASSLVVLRGERVELLSGADRLDQLLGLIPNVQTGSGGEGPTIRGQDSTGALRDLPAFLGGTRPRATLQVDGRAAIFNEFVFGVTPVWDVAQIEIFRSPQTTTQGPNAIAGAIFVETRAPVFEWEGRARAVIGNERVRQASVAASGPIVADQLAFRIAADARSGRTSSLLSDRHEGVDPNDDWHAILRFRLRAEPRAIAGLRLDAIYVHNESQAPQFEGIRQPFRERRDPLATYGVFHNRTDSLTLRSDASLAPGLESSVTLSRGHARIRRYAPTGLGEIRMRSRDLSAESILRWRPGGDALLIGGVHYQRTVYDQAIDLTAVLGLGSFDDRQDSFGLFAEADFPILPWLRATAGVRRERDSQDRQGAIGPLLLDYDRTFQAWLPKAVLTASPLSGLDVGILVQRAFNPGGTTINLATGAAETFEPEILWNYELFARAEFAGGRGRVAANVFHNDIANAQRARARLLVTPRGTAVWAEIDNLPAAETQGAELELDWQAHRRLWLRAGLGLLSTRILRGASPADPLTGREFQRSPGLTLAGEVEWRPLSGLSLSAQLRHHSAYFSDDANNPLLKVGAATTLDARAAYARGSFTISAWVRNAANAFHLSFLLAADRATADDPRQWGVAFELRF